MTFNRTTSDNPDFRKLVQLLDIFLKERDGDDHVFYAQFNKIDTIRNVIVCYSGDIAIGCGAFKEYDDDTVEIKRMYVLPEYRGKGVATMVLAQLETWAKENNYSTCILETVVEPNEAIGLYLKAGYSFIPNFGQYVNATKSLCMKKVLV
jgi:GNAT superfamily N-acetyltransferase